MVNDRPERRDEDWRYLPRRPGVSGMAAMVAVAVAIFVLGGYVRTYRQLEALRAQHKRTSDELENYKRQGSRSRTAAAKRKPDFAVPELPQARSGAERPRSPVRVEIPEIAGPSGPAAPLSESGAPRQRAPAGLRPLERMPEEVRAGNEAFRPAASAVPLLEERAERVVSVSREKGTLVIEGGRNRGRVAGQMLALRRGGAQIADIRVTDVFAAESICEILNESMSLLPGDIVAGGAESHAAWGGEP